ncbi:MAG: hypothetical protein K2P84_04830 [Undibacterium sp.]|nr:hypothetical protein [Undibacterium sp.]
MSLSNLPSDLPIKKIRRISKALPLVLASSASVMGLSACDSNDEGNTITTVQDEYTSIEACQEDWGNASTCQPAPTNTVTDSNTSHYIGSRYYGPIYPVGERLFLQRTYLGNHPALVAGQIHDHSVTRQVSQRSSSSISRGGFGSSSHGSSGGG